MTSPLNLTLGEARDALKAKKISSQELTQAYLSAIESLNPALNAYITVTPERALKDAKAADERLAKGQGGALEGIPLAIKDLFCTKGTQTTAGSHMLEGFVPPYESSVTTRLWDAGAVMLGKTNLDEFAMGSSNTTSYFGNVVSPWKARGSDKDLVPGGSSGGSAAAVAARLCLAATGTDTGGSIRQPAAFCGIVGVKPTYGRCSRWGIVAFASSLDQAGMFARNVRDAAITQTVICGHDPKDSTSSLKPVPDFEKALTGNIKGLKIGIPEEYHFASDEEPVVQNEINYWWREAQSWLKASGAEIVSINLPHTKYALPTYYIIAPAEASSNLARYDGVRYGQRVTPESGGIQELYKKTRAAGFGKEVKRRILIGTYVLSAGYYDAYYKKAQRVRYLIVQDFKKAFEKVDAILTPTAPSAAFAIGENTFDPVTMYLNDVFTIPASMAGLPALSLPVGLSKTGLPLGLQIIGKSFDEETVFRVAGVMEEAAQFKALPQRVAV
jgi:aspartyl-tRNA(Asn)/glutamyl-tRNA(Gln) amidotransferase subunit A